jgi:hypothetical protein
MLRVRKNRMRSALMKLDIKSIDSGTEDQINTEVILVLPYIFSHAFTRKNETKAGRCAQFGELSILILAALLNLYPTVPGTELCKRKP